MRRLSSVVIQIQWQRSRIAPTTPARIRTDRIHRQKSCSDSLCNVRYWPFALFRCLGKFGRFSNRPFWVKRFQAIHQCSVDVTRGLVLLFGLGTRALPLWDSRTRRNNLLDGLAVRRTAGTSDQTNSPHPSSRKGHHSTARWSSRFLLSDVILCSHTAAASCLVQRNSVPSTQMRCMITAKRRASATIAFFIPRRLATCIAQALSHDHFFERTSMLWAAS